MYNEKEIKTTKEKEVKIDAGDKGIYYCEKCDRAWGIDRHPFMRIQCYFYDIPTICKMLGVEKLEHKLCEDCEKKGCDRK